MRYYFAIVHKDEDSAYGVTFPDLPGCFSAADRLEDVVPNAIEALDLWFEDQDEVEPSAAASIVERCKADLAEGALLFPVPRIQAGGGTVRINLSMDRYMLEAIDTAARRRKITRSAFVAEAAREMIKAGA